MYWNVVSRRVEALFVIAIRGTRGRGNHEGARDTACYGRGPRLLVVIPATQML